MGSVRLFIGGLPSDATADQVSQRFAPFGTVTACELPGTKAEFLPHCGRGFCYVDLIPANDKAVTRCITTYNGCSWKGSKLRVEAARPDPLVKYAKERLAEDLPAPEPSASAPVPQNSTLQEASDMPSFALTQPASGKALIVSPSESKHLFPPGRMQSKAELSWAALAAPPGSRKPVQARSQQQPGKRDWAAASLGSVPEDSDDSEASDDSDASEAVAVSAEQLADSDDSSDDSDTASEGSEQPGSWDAEVLQSFERMCTDMMLPTWPQRGGQGAVKLHREASSDSEVTSVS